MALTKSKWILKDDQSLMNGASGALQVKVTGPVIRTAEGLTIDDVSITNAMLAGSIEDGKLTSSYIYADGTRAFTGNQDMGGFKLTGVGLPTTSTDATNKEYVDSLAAGLDPKASCRVATTSVDGDLNLTDAPATVDGVTLVDGDRVLVKNQTDATENGIYVFTSGTPNTLTRSSDFDGTPAHEVSGGSFTFIEVGTSNQGTGWVLLGDGDLVVGTDDILWSQFSSLGVLTAGDGITITSNKINVGEGHGIQVDTDSVTVKIDGTTLTKSVDGLKVASSGITSTEINSSSLGNGLTGGDGTSLSVVPNAALGVQVDGDGVGVVLDGTTLSVSASGLKVDAAGITSVELNTSIAGGGLTGGGGSVLSVVTGNGLTVTAGVDGVVELTALTSDWVLGTGTGDFTITGVPLPEDDYDVANKLYVDESIAALATRKVETFELDATDITNKYIDLESNPRFVTAVGVYIRHAPNQLYGVDYVITSDGTDDKRLSWDGLALEGVLEAGDQLTAVYDLE